MIVNSPAGSSYSKKICDISLGSRSYWGYPDVLHTVVNGEYKNIYLDAGPHDPTQADKNSIIAVELKTGGTGETTSCETTGGIKKIYEYNTYVTSVPFIFFVEDSGSIIFGDD